MLFDLEPILATCTLPPSDGYRVARTMRVVGGLHYLRGNAAPHFTLTADIFRKGNPEQCQSGGLVRVGQREAWT